MYPLKRNRRLRTSAAVRSLVREQSLSVDDFIVPLFVVEGSNIKEEIPSMPDYYRISLDLLVDEVKVTLGSRLKECFTLCKSPKSFKRQ